MAKKAEAQHTAPKKVQFKLHQRARHRGTILVSIIFVVMTVLLYTATPAELPMFFQKLIGAVHACVAGLLVMTVIKEFAPKQVHHDDPHHHDHDHGNSHSHKQVESKSPSPSYPPRPAATATATITPASARDPKPMTAPGSHSSEFAHLHQMHRATQRRRKVAAIVGGIVAVIVFGLWFTPAAPISVPQFDMDLSKEINESATQTFLVLADPSIPIPVRPTICRACNEMAKKMSTGGSSYRQALIALAKDNYEQARSLLKVAKENMPEDVDKIDLALGQVDLFNGNMPAAIKQFEEMQKKNKNDSLTMMHLAIAHLHAGSYQKALPLAQKVYSQSKSASPEERARSINLLLAIQSAVWQRNEMTKLQTEGIKLTSENPGMHFAALKNNLGVLEILANPPNFGAAQVMLNGAIELGGKCKKQSGTEIYLHSCDIIPKQNLNAILWEQRNPYEMSKATVQFLNQLKDFNELNPVRIAAEQAWIFSNIGVGDYSGAAHSLVKTDKILKEWPKTNLFVLSEAMLAARHEAILGNWSSAVIKNDGVIKRFSEFARNHPAIAAARMQKLMVALETSNKTTDESLKDFEKLIEDTNQAYQNAGLGSPIDMALIQRSQAYLLWQRKKSAEAYSEIQSAIDSIAKRVQAKDSAKKYPLHVEVAKLLMLKSLIQADDQKSDEALKTMADAERLAQESTNGNSSNPDVRKIVLESAKLLIRLNRNSDAEQKLDEWEQNVDDISPTHPTVLEVWNLHASLLKKAKKDTKIYDERIKQFYSKTK